MPKRMFSLVLVAVMSLGAIAATHASAGGGGDREVIRRGGCSGGSDWKYKVKRDDGRLEAEYEVDQNRNGDRWRVTLKHERQPLLQGHEGD